MSNFEHKEVFYSGTGGANTAAFIVLISGTTIAIAGYNPGWNVIFVPYGIIFISLIVFIIFATLYEHGKWFRSLVITDNAILYREAIYTVQISISSILGIRFERLDANKFGGRYASPGHIMTIAYRGDDGSVKGLGIPIHTFPKKIRKELLTRLFYRHATLPLHTSSTPYLKGIDIEATNPIIDEFPRVSSKGGWLKRFGLQPKFSEAALFLMSVAFFVIFLLNQDGVLFDLQRVLDVAANTRKGGNIIIFIAYMGVGLLYSVYHIFKRGKKSDMARSAMLWFGIGITAGTGILGGMYVWRTEVGWVPGVVSVWNTLYGFALLFTLRAHSSHTQVEQRDAKLHEVVIGCVMLAAIIWIGMLRNTYWAVLFSGCVAYITAFNTHIDRLPAKIKKKFPDVGFELALLDRVEERSLEFRKKHGFISALLLFLFFYLAVRLLIYIAYIL